MRRPGHAPGVGGLALVWLALLGCVLGAPPAQAAPRVSVTLDRNAIAPGDVAQMTIGLADEDARPLMPQVPGLHIALVGQRVASQFGTGGNTTIFSRVYEITADHEGDFSIAPISVDGVRLPPVHLKVSASASGAGQTQGAGGAAGAGPRRVLPFMRVVLPRSRLYVGEQVPIQIKAYFREGTEARMEGALAVNGDAFTATRLDSHPERTEESINGDTWTVLTWSSVLGAIKSGDYPLNVELPLLVRYRVGGDSDMEERLRAFFGMASPGGFMGDDVDAIFGRTEQRHLTLKPEGVSIKVLPLPEAGRPADFSGAVGRFDVAAAVAPATGAVGDPLTLKITVSGTGNFSRVSTPGLPESEQWRTYRPAEQLAMDNDAALSGAKTFAQPIVPRQAGRLQVPAIGFSWFDPESGRYMTRQTPVLEVQAAPGVEVATAASAASAPRQAVAARPAPPARPATGRVTRSLRPLIRQPWFAAVLAAPVLCLLLVLAWRAASARLAGTTSGQAGSQMAQRSLARMDAAIAQGDAAGFFGAARAALQEFAPQGAALQAILHAADHVSYGGGAMSQDELRQWRQAVAELLRGAEQA